MLAIISDLHLQHTSDDVVRYRTRAGTVVECGVRRNVSTGALRRWFALIHDAVLRQRVRHVELVLAGDVFELVRTPLWFLDNPEGIRPTQRDLGPDVHSNLLRRKIHAILDAIEQDNRAFFQVLARFVREKGYQQRGRWSQLPDGVEITVHFLPGNHDRLANAWPSVRRRVRSLLAMADSDDPFPHVLENLGGPRQAGYGVLVRHGHEYDRWNFPGEVARGAALNVPGDVYLRPPIGDAMGIDIALRCAVAFRAVYASELRSPGPEGDRFRKLYLALLEFDDVRPTGSLFDYLAQQRNRLGDDPLTLLRPVIRDVFAQVCSDPFFLAEAQKMGIAAWFTDPIASIVLRGIDHLPSKWAVALPFAWPFRGADTEVPPAQLAQHEPALRQGLVDTIVAGHSHYPDAVPLRGRRRRSADAFFVDSGTWRASILSGPSERFGRILGYCAVFCYSPDEKRRDGSEGRRFESWTGHAAAGKLGPYAESRGSARIPRRHLYFDRLVVEREGSQPGESLVLDLRFGVDGKARHWLASGVRPGDAISLQGVSPIALLPDLDGEVWLTGRAVRDGLLERDEALPWALHLLPRASEPQDEAANLPQAMEKQPSRARPRRPDFLLGPCQVAVVGRNGWRLRLEFRVEPLVAFRTDPLQAGLISGVSP